MKNEAKYHKYIEVFKKSFPNKEITDKSYNVTLVRYILMYFLYLEKRTNKSIKYDDIAKIFGCDSSSVCVAVKKVKQYNSIEKIKLLGNKKELFRYFYTKFNRIFHSKQ